MRKLILPGLAALFFMLAAGFPILFAESGGFEVPKVDDHFEEVNPGPADEQPVSQEVKKESPSSEKSSNPIGKAWNWFKGKVKGVWEGTKEFLGDLWD